MGTDLENTESCGTNRNKFIEFCFNFHESVSWYVIFVFFFNLCGIFYRFLCSNDLLMCNKTIYCDCFTFLNVFEKCNATWIPKNTGQDRLSWLSCIWRISAAFSRFQLLRSLLIGHRCVMIDPWFIYCYESAQNLIWVWKKYRQIAFWIIVTLLYLVFFFF